MAPHGCAAMPVHGSVMTHMSHCLGAGVRREWPTVHTSARRALMPASRGVTTVLVAAMLFGMLARPALAVTLTFSAATSFTAGSRPQSVAIGDLNGDGKSDLAVANVNSGDVSVLLNTTGPGVSPPTFSAATDFVVGSRPVSVVIGELNGDGKPDLAVANASSDTVSVLLNLTGPGASPPI